MNHAGTVKDEEVKKKQPEEHVHRYMRIRLGKKGYTVFKCMKPGCPHMTRAELVIGNFAECWRCDAKMVMNQWHIQYKKPHCRVCTRVHPNPAKRPKPDGLDGQGLS